MTEVRALRLVETELRVRYSETDRMGIVYHANYIVWFEIGRTEFCRAAGLPYRAMEDAGLLILVTAVECTYRRSARYDDAIRIRARLPELSSRGLAFAYDIVDAGGRRLADGRSRHVFADPDGRPRRAPEELIAPLVAFRLSDAASRIAGAGPGGPNPRVVSRRNIGRGGEGP